MLFPRTVALLGFLAVGACGFSPVYSEKTVGSTSVQLNNIQIAPTSDRTTQLVRNSLIKQFSNRGETQTPQYYLRLIVTETLSSALIRRTTDIQRSNLTISASYILQTANRKTVLTKGRTVSITPYNLVSRDFGTISNSEFANISARKDARKKAAISVGEDISRRLAAYFATRT
jgi:LPS-assembly lipoprotein